MIFEPYSDHARSVLGSDVASDRVIDCTRVGFFIYSSVSTCNHVNLRSFYTASKES